VSEPRRARADAGRSIVVDRARTTIDELLTEARGRIRRLTPDQAHQAQTGGAIIVDTRDSTDRLAEGSIPGAIVVTRNTLEWRVDPTAELPDPVLSDYERELIIVCNDGYASSLAADSLRRIGHPAVADVIGGFRAWRASGLPIV
jgi:rhodanese-related sulfurtransferase